MLQAVTSHRLIFFSFLVLVFAQEFRPQFHAVPPSNWINDPNGPIFYEGQYHLFFQYNPEAAVWGNISWGHMQSTDMIHWEWKGVALYPGNSDSDPDHAGCWTGSAVIDITGSNLPTILYTAVRGDLFYETQMLAVASDSNITSWLRPSETPVINGPPRNEMPGNVSGFRDPTFWYDDEISKWRLFIGSGVKDVGGYILQYNSDKLEGPWTYIKPLIVGNVTYHGDMWECPDFFRLETLDGTSSRWVLIFGDDSMQRNFYMIGTFDKTNEIFIPDEDFAHGRFLDSGNFYASKTMLDSNTGLRILWGWSPEDRSVETYSASGWAGIQTLPRILKLSNDLSSLVFQELPAIQELKQGMATNGTQLSIHLAYHFDPSSNIVVNVLQSSGKEEFTKISYSPISNLLAVDRTYSSLSPATNHSVIYSTVYFPDTHPKSEVTMRILIDHSIIEVIANSVTCITARVYPTLPDSKNIELITEPDYYSIQQLSGIY